VRFDPGRVEQVRQETDVDRDRPGRDEVVVEVGDIRFERRRALGDRRRVALVRVGVQREPVEQQEDLAGRGLVVRERLVSHRCAEPIDGHVDRLVDDPLEPVDETAVVPLRERRHRHRCDPASSGRQVGVEADRRVVPLVFPRVQ